MSNKLCHKFVCVGCATRHGKKEASNTTNLCVVFPTPHKTTHHASTLCEEIHIFHGQTTAGGATHSLVGISRVGARGHASCDSISRFVLQPLLGELGWRGWMLWNLQYVLWHHLKLQLWQQGWQRHKDSKYDDTMVSTTTQQSTLYGIAGRRKTTQQGWQQQQQQCTWQQTAQWTMRRWTTDTKRTAENDKDNRWWRRTMRMTEDNNRQPQQTTTTDINNGPHILFSLCLALDYFAQPPTLVCSSNIIANDGKCCVSHFDTLADMRIGRVGDMSDNMLVTCWWHDTLCCQNRRQANTA